jgi:hypothetical protein
MITRDVLGSAGRLVLASASVALVGVLLFLACNRDSTEAEIVGPVEPTTEEVGHGLTPATVPLPFFGAVNSAVAAFWVRQTGTGESGRFEILNSNSIEGAVEGLTYGKGPAISGLSQGLGSAAFFRNNVAASTAPTVHVRALGRGDGVQVQAEGGGRAGVFQIFNPNTFANALEGITNGRAAAVYGANGGTGGAARFVNTPTSNSAPAVNAVTNGTGSVLQADHYGSSGNLALFRVNGNNRIRFTHDGKGIFNGGTQTGGADVAEAFAVEGRISAYEPGDVLVISTRSDRTVEKAGEPYSTRVVGVYATRPGVLLTERGVDESLEGLVPVGMMGVIPTKVSAENGPIRRGDLLVTARTPGYAMRADPDRLRFGMVLGKALGELRRAERGMIPVLVNVK